MWRSIIWSCCWLYCNARSWSNRIYCCNTMLNETFPTIDDKRADMLNVRWLNDRAWFLQYGDPAQARLLAERAQKIAESEGDASGSALAQVNLACYEMRYGDHGLAGAEFLRLKQIFVEIADKSALMRACFGVAVGLANGGDAQGAYAELIDFEPDLTTAVAADVFVISNMLGMCCSELGFMEQGLRYFYRTLAAARELDSADHLAMIFSNLGDFQHNHGNYEDALHFLEEAKAIQSKSRLGLLGPLIACNLAQTQLALGKFEAALATIEPFLELDTRAVRIGKGDNAFLFAIAAHVRTSQGNWGDARALIDKAMMMATSSGQQSIVVQCHLVHGLIERGEGNLEASLAAFKEAESRQTNVKDPYFSLQIPKQLARAYARLGRWNEAYDYLNQYQQLYQRSMTDAARARSHVLLLQSELQNAERARDLAQAKHAASEHAREDLQQMNEELARKVVEIERLQAQLREQAIRDPLTNLYNRRYLQEQLVNAIKLSDRHHYSTAVVLIDLDYFKAVNDQFGHSMGDKVLVELGRLLVANIRGSDFACRYGGEEFCVVLCDVDLAFACQRIELILSQFHALVVEESGMKIKELTFSAGVATYPQHGKTPEMLISAADSALYKAKAKGRNQIALAYDML